NSTNTVYVGVYSDLNGTALAEGILNLNIAPNGNWFTATLNPAIQFNPNETFYLVVGADGFISFPAGFDYTATVPNNSFYFDVATSAWVNINTIPAFANGAFLVRASGDYIGGSNNPPTAVANVPSSGQVNQSVTFDGSGSFDTDGSITAYAWNFGDGTNANQAVASHSYSSAGTFTWSLTVTDDDGATGQTSGQITITGGGGGSRLTVAPTSGTVAPGGSQTITATYDAIGQNAGTYNGTIQITGNGGTINLPVSVFVDPSVGIDDDVVVSEGFSLGQNYPNPFNPTTEIAYRLENSGPVSLTVYNSLGQKVRTLVNSNQPAGAFQVRWDARNDQGQPVVSGVYIYTLRAGQQTLTRKMTLTR
ncbi:MAG: PKD domain-containing protein, partial [Calditrichaeota bacterium]|nr:PKD domain-containing protein [Calditrichota bacterium]